jgi:hypothetical protein
MKIKTLLTTAAALMVAVQGYSQGTILFANGTDSRIIDGRTGAASFPNIYTVGLYVGSASASEGELNLVATTTISGLSFLRGVFSGGDVILDGISGTAAFQVKAWDNAFASYEEAAATGRADVWVGSSALLTTALGDGGLVAPGDIVADGGFSGFTTSPVPEPSTIAFGILGGIGAMVLLRRRK